MNLLFVSSENVVGGFAPRLEHIIRDVNLVKWEQRCWKQMSRVFVRTEFGLERAVGNRASLICPKDRCKTGCAWGRTSIIPKLEYKALL